jgi:hypothetical protein
MRYMNTIPTIVLLVSLAVGTGVAQRNVPLSENAALRYWSAFSEVQDSALTDRQAKDLNAILDGTAPYDDSKYKGLVEKNKLALEIMTRATSFPNCDWGLDYGLLEDTPVDYARKALVLGRLNVLYASHLFVEGNKDGGVRALSAGLRFSHDVANGGSLFATIIAKGLLANHLRAVLDALHREQLSAEQRTRLQQAVAGLGSHGVDWRSAMKLEMAILNRPAWQESDSVGRVTQAYLATVNDPSQLSKLEQVLGTVPQPLRDVVPNPKKVLEQKQELDEKITETRLLLQR